MSVRRVGGLAAIAAAMVFWMSCGEVYRPVVIPTTTIPPNPANFHEVFGISANAPSIPGSALQIDVAGDTNIGEANMGIIPTHAAILPNNSRVFVASAGSFSGDPDVVTAFSPATDSAVVTGLGNPVTFTYPNIGPADPNTGLPQWTCSYLPDYVATTSTTNAYVANFGVENDPACAPAGLPYASTESVSVLGTSGNTISKIAYLPAGSHPVAMVETPNTLNLYVLNQGNSTVMDLSPTDLSQIGATISVGTTPVWAVARVDSQRVFIVTQGDGKLYTINTATNAVDAGVSVGGAGANFVQYDKSRNRLYVTNPVAQAVYVFDATQDPPASLATIAMGTGSAVCANGCAPVSVAALPDGSRFYVASYQTPASCPDANIGTAVKCMVPMLTVFDAGSFNIKPIPSTQSPLAPSLSLLASPQFSATQYAVPAVDGCVTPATYSPGTTRFRMFTAASTDSSHVYVTICDGGSIADVITTTTSIAQGSNTPDSLVTDLPSPFAGCVSASCSTVATVTGFSISSNVVTFQAANTFVPGQRVAISNLTSTAGINELNGQKLTVIATGLSSTQFECTLTGTQADAPATSDTGSAVPLPPLQTPLFLLTGQ